MKTISDYRRDDFEYECSRCARVWAACTCPVPDPEIVAQRIAAERARLQLGAR